jgi:hypothetical protein
VDDDDDTITTIPARPFAWLDVAITLLDNASTLD